MNWIIDRAKEPSTWAGLAVGCIIIRNISLMRRYRLEWCEVIIMFDNLVIFPPYFWKVFFQFLADRDQIRIIKFLNTQ